MRLQIATRGIVTFIPCHFNYAGTDYADFDEFKVGWTDGRRILKIIDFYKKLLYNIYVINKKGNSVLIGLWTDSRL